MRPITSPRGRCCLPCVSRQTLAYLPKCWMSLSNIIRNIGTLALSYPHRSSFLSIDSLLLGVAVLGIEFSPNKELGPKNKL